jgi:Methyltransferase domain
MKGVTRLVNTAKAFRYAVHIALKGRTAPPLPYSRYDELEDRCRARNPERIMEIGVWRGDRAVRLIKCSTRLVEYVGFDLFEEMSEGTFEREGMGQCVALDVTSIQRRLEEVAGPGIQLQLVRGNTFESLPAFASITDSLYDFVYLDGGHSLDTVANDWKHASGLLSQDGVCILDDYYLEDVSMGCKHLIDHLDRSLWDVDFFEGVKKTREGHYITMAAVSRRNPGQPRTSQ